MNKVVKRKLIASIFCIIIGIIIYAYTSMSSKVVNEDSASYLNGFAFGVVFVGMYTMFVVIHAINSPNKGKNLENTANDERLKKIYASSMAITLKISLMLEAACSIIFAFSNKLQISEYIGFIICIQLIVFVVVYLIVSKKN